MAKEGESRATVLSAIQPTAEMHIGNYFGAVRNWVELQDRARCIYGVVDLHAMTIRYDPAELRENTRAMFVSLLAAGIDPERSELFVQSLVPEHAELSWILTTLTSLGDLSRMTQFKEKAGLLEASADDANRAGEEFVSAGLLVYPVLQAADILAYRPRYVPVGQDQQQHLELTRGLARRFNSRFGEDFFPEPEPLFTETPKIMSLADPERKMSKSLGSKHYIGLFEEEDSIRKKVRSAVTDVGPAAREEMSPGVRNLVTILDACGRGERAREMERLYDSGELRYKELKDEVADALVELTSSLRERRDRILAEGEDLDDLIHTHSASARRLARETLGRVRELTGLPSVD